MGAQCSHCKVERGSPGYEAPLRSFTEQEGDVGIQFDHADRPSSLPNLPLSVLVNRLHSKDGSPSKPSVPLKLPPGKMLTAMMFGMSGSGKSSLGNLIARSTVFSAGNQNGGKLNSVMKFEAEDRSLTVLDTIGLGDTEIDQDKVGSSLRDVAVSAINGIDMLLFVMRSDRITDDAIMRLIYVVECLWGRDCVPNLYIALTFASKYAKKKEDADSWIARELENNWRFRHIYSLVGNDATRFVFIDNPDPASSEPALKERRQRSYEAMMKMFCLHRRDIIQPFTHAMMRKAKDMLAPEFKDLKAKELEVQRMHDKINKAVQNKNNRLQSKVSSRGASGETEPADVISSVSTCSGNSVTQADLEKAEKDRLMSQRALESKMDQIKHDEHFKEEAAQQIEVSVMKFQKHLKGDSPNSCADNEDVIVQAKDKAGGRMLTMLKVKARKVMNSITGGTPSGSVAHECQDAPEKKSSGVVAAAVTPRLSNDDIERALDCVVARLRASFGGLLASEVYFHRWGACDGLTPVTFNGYCYWSIGAVKGDLSIAHTPETKAKLIAALWRRADSNSDGKVDFNEFCALFGEA